MEYIKTTEAKELIKKMTSNEELMELSKKMMMQSIFKLEYEKVIKFNYVKIEKEEYHANKKLDDGEKNYRYITKSSVYKERKYFRIDYELA